MFVYELSGSGFESSCSHLKTSDFAPASSKEVLDIQATIECGFTLKRVRDMIRTYIANIQIWWQKKNSDLNIYQKIVIQS